MKGESEKAKGKTGIPILAFCLFTFNFCLSSVSAQEMLETRSFAMNGCIQMIYKQQFVFKEVIAIKISEK